MNIGIVGLGLIGGSLAKSAKKNTEFKVFGYDLNSDVVKNAIKFNNPYFNIYVYIFIGR